MRPRTPPAGVPDPPVRTLDPMSQSGDESERPGDQPGTPPAPPAPVEGEAPGARLSLRERLWAAVPTTGLSLANKCLLLFGGAVILIVCRAGVPAAAMNGLVERDQLGLSRRWWMRGWRRAENRTRRASPERSRGSRRGVWRFGRQSLWRRIWSGRGRGWSAGRASRNCRPDGGRTRRGCTAMCARSARRRESLAGVPCPARQQAHQQTRHPARHPARIPAHRPGGSPRWWCWSGGPTGLWCCCCSTRCTSSSRACGCSAWRCWCSTSSPAGSSCRRCAACARRPSASARATSRPDRTSRPTTSSRSSPRPSTRCWPTSSRRSPSSGPSTPRST